MNDSNDNNTNDSDVNIILNNNNNNNIKDEGGEDGEKFVKCQKSTRCLSPPQTSRASACGCVLTLPVNGVAQKCKYIPP